MMRPHGSNHQTGTMLPNPAYVRRSKPFQTSSGKSLFCTFGANCRSQRLAKYSASTRTRQPHVTGMPWANCARRCARRRFQMELRNEEQFEKYLKQFRPIAPQHSLPKPVKSGHDGMIWLTAVAAIWILIALAVGIRDHRSAGQQPIAT